MHVPLFLFYFSRLIEMREKKKTNEVVVVLRMKSIGLNYIGLSWTKKESLLDNNKNLILDACAFVIYATMLVVCSALHRQFSYGAWCNTRTPVFATVRMQGMRPFKRAHTKHTSKRLNHSYAQTVQRIFFATVLFPVAVTNDLCTQP